VASFELIHLVLRERYLRDDIDSGIRGISTNENAPLPPRGDLSHTLFPHGHFIILDTNVVLHQVLKAAAQSSMQNLLTMSGAKMDLLESELFSPPLIVLQTVIEEVRHRSLPLFNRLKALSKTDGKSVWIFHNEFNAYEAIVQLWCSESTEAEILLYLQVYCCRARAE
jgi:exosome complex exonuclease DIS3/RRP44